MWNPLREREQQLQTFFPDTPPKALLIRLLGRNIAVDGDEFQRAQWFWARRPKKLILSRDLAIRIVTFYLLLWVASMFVQEQAQVVGWRG